MSGGEIAGIIAASGFVLLVLFVGVPLIKLGRVLDETRISLRNISEEVTPLLSELTETVESTNKQLVKVDAITQNVSEVTGNVSALVALFTSTLGSPLVKIAGVASGLRSFLKSKN
ncbi:MAG: hypothetical protein RL508_1072 [Actinomycetota bacterium]|jgi:uncharacterized protein YoxC